MIFTNLTTISNEFNWQISTFEDCFFMLNFCRRNYRLSYSIVLNVNFQKAEFDWDMKTKGFILSVFSIGYLCGWLGGILALKFGATTIFGVGITVTAILAVLSPILIRIHLSVYIVARLLEGVFEVSSYKI